MSRLDEKLLASIKATRGKPAVATKAAPAKVVATKPADKPAAPQKTEQKRTPAKPGSAGIPGNTSTLFPERIWPD